MAAEHLPKELGGEGLTVPEVAEKHGLSTDAVYKALQNEDVRDAQARWRDWAWKQHRRLGPKAVVALEHLIEQEEPRAVIDYWRRTGISDEPTATVDMEPLALIYSVEDPLAESRKRLREAELACPLCREIQHGTLGFYDHMVAQHGSQVPWEAHGVKPHPCPVPGCGQILANSSEFFQHLLAHNAAPAGQLTTPAPAATGALPCPFCSYSTSNQFEFLRHLNAQHAGQQA
jgi:hypothetical protein